MGTVQNLGISQTSIVLDILHMKIGNTGWVPGYFQIIRSIDGARCQLV
jgi:hypothetical protein